VSELMMVAQRNTLGGCVPWILDEAGNRIEGLDDDRRLSEVQEGLERHPRVRGHSYEVDGDRVRQTLCALHEPGYLRTLEQAPEGEAVLIGELAEPGLAPDTPVCAAAFTAAQAGIATSIAAAISLLEGARFAYALCRPPGHHAGPAWLGGYCYLNNAAAAAHTIASGTPSCDRETQVAILDIDLHYPNGTAGIVARCSSMTLHSLHGSTGANLPWERVIPRSERERLVSFRSAPSEAEYLDRLESMIAEIRRDACAIVLSLGYDTIADDPHGGWSFAPSIFTQIGRLLAGSGLPVCVVQEGGYALGSLAQCSHAFVTGLLNGGGA
jgi:acetoin utilization deacetylase AcuC-like enzyme